MLNKKLTYKCIFNLVLVILKGKLVASFSVLANIIITKQDLNEANLASEKAIFLNH